MAKKRTRTALGAAALGLVLLAAGPAATPNLGFGPDRPGGTEAADGRSAGSADAGTRAVRGRPIADTPPGPGKAVPQPEHLPAGKPLAESERVRERIDGRTANAKFYDLSDGRVQAEVSGQPLHYRDAAGNWQDIDTRVGASGRPGYPYAAEKNTFTSHFGDDTGRLIEYNLGGRKVTVGASGAARPAQPKVTGSTVTYPDVFDTADVAYDVTSTSLKEKIVLDRAPSGDASYSFDVTLDGVVATANEDGSVSFTAADSDGAPLFYLPKPFMYDSGASAASPTEGAFSGKVTQKLSGSGNRLTLTMTADAEWLRSRDRKYPVVIDPTIKVQPQVGQAQDGMINSYEPGTNYDALWRLSVGTNQVNTTTTATFRSLVKFPLTEVPKGTRLDSAQLKLYWDQTMTDDSDKHVVPIEAHRVTAPWAENTVTWNSINKALGEVGTNTEQVDNADPGKTTASGEWPSVSNAAAISGGFRSNSDATAGNSFTWVPRITEAGSYDVQVHYVAGADRATNAPYTVHHAGATPTVKTVNQTTGSGNGKWVSIGAYNFRAGTTSKVVLGDVAGKVVSADAVRLVKRAAVSKGVDQNHAWHTFSVRSIVQDWIDQRQDNNGFMVKATNEAQVFGGPRYSGAENAYGGEVDTFPTLLLTWGRPGVTLQMPTTIRSTGAELAWSAYPDTSPNVDKPDDLVEYQVHRSKSQSFIPSAATLVAPVRKDRTAYSDSSGTPTPSNSATEFGAPFYYMIVVKTRDGELIPSPTEQVQLPKAGHIVRVLQGNSTDTTLTSKEPTLGHDKLDGGGLLQVGNNGSIYGTSRAVVKWPSMTGLPAGTRVLSAKVGLWGAWTTGSGARFQMHGATRDFDEATGSWNAASPGVAWSTPGGDYTATPSDSVGPIGGDPRWQNWSATNLVQGWVNNPASNKGVLFRLANETTPTQRVLFTSGEVPDIRQRPRLEVIYTAPATENTYYAPHVPQRMIPGDEYTSPVTVTNSTGSPWPKADWVLSYRWTLPDGTDVTTGDNQRETPFPTDLTPGNGATVNAKIMTPVRTDQGNKRQAFVLNWDLRNKTTGQWLSKVWGIAPLSQNVTVEDPTSDQLGLERFYQYTGKNSGAGSTVMVNQFSGNAVFSYNAFSNPSRGTSSFVRLSYNSRDSSNSYIGYGWSLSTSSVVRLGSPLAFSGGDARWPAKITLTDGDGTGQFYELNKHGSTNEKDWDYDNPAGVHLYLQRNSDDNPVRTWVLTRPDRSHFYFDADGYQTSVVDKNGNDLRFTYERTGATNRNTGVLKYLTDATGRRTLTFEYFAPGENYNYFAGNSKVAAANLANGQIINQLRSITDITGRRITFTYSDQGLLRQMIDGEGDTGEKPFNFFYDTAAGITNQKLVRVDDPRGNGTKLAYHPQSDGDLLKWRVNTLTDRVDKATLFTYRAPGGSDASSIESTVTDANSHVSKYILDGFGRTREMTNAKQQKTILDWDADNNVRQMTEANGAVTRWEYDQKTGLPLEITDPEATKNKTAPQKFGYRFGLNGHTAELTSKTSPEGRKHEFGYDQFGNLTSVTDPAGTATTTEGDYTSVYTYDTWGQQLTSTDANDNTTKYEDYDPVGYPKRIIDALNNVETYEYDEVGNVLAVTDANKHTSTYTYDTFARPLSSKVPKDAANNVYIVTPGPTYDRNDNVVLEKGANGAVTEAGHDPADRLQFVIEPKDTPTGLVRTISYEYDNVGNLIKETEPKGNLTPTVTGDYATRYVHDELNQLSEVIDAAGGTMVSTYDNVGNLKSVADQRKTATPDVNDFSEKYEYDLNRRPIVVTDAIGHTTKKEYDRDGNATVQVDQDGNRTLTAYDARSAPREQKVPHKKTGDTISYRTTQFDYDEVGNQTKVTSPRGVETTNDPEDFAKVTVYDALNRVKEQREPYDKNDARTEYQTADTTIYGYDKVGNTETVSSPPSHGETKRNVTTYTYWDNGWNKTSTDPWEIKTEYDYDALGNQTSRKVTGSGKTRQMNWTFFPDGKQKSQSDDGEGGTGARKSFTFSYDVNANLTEMQDLSTDAKIDTYAMTYDAVNRMKSVEEKLKSVVKNTTSYEYEPNDTLRERRHDKTYTKYDYDARDLIKSVTNGKSATDPKAKTTTFTYTSRTQLETEKKSNGNTVTYAYYLNQQLRHQVEKKASGAVVNEHTIEYDVNGHRSKDVAKKQNADNKANTLDNTTTYKYDPRDRIREQVKTGHGAGTESYIHDANSNVIEQTVKGSKTTFDYDRNRLKESVTAGVTSTYKYDHFGRQESTTTANIETEKYTYDGFDRTKSHKKTPGGLTEYTYDPLNRQQTRKQNSKTTELTYLGLGEQVLAEEEGGKLRKTYQYGPDGKLLSQAKYKDDGSFEESYQGYNPHTDVEQITDEQGDSRATYGYTAYGSNDDQQFTGVDKPDGANPEDPNKEPYNAYRFNGKRFDQSTGDYDMGFRDYDPGLNRFLTQDNYNGALADMNLTTDPFTNNRYAFGGGNPISQVELDGHISWSDVGHAALDVVGLVPVAGEVADLANAAWYAAEGDYANAALSAASAVPGLGYAASAVKAGKYAAKGVDAAQGAAKGADASRSGAKATSNGSQAAGRSAPAPAKSQSGGGGPAKSSPKATGGGGGKPAGQRVLFGQKRADPNFSTKPGVPGDLKGRALDDVAGDLASGRMSTDRIRIEAFEYQGHLVSTNTRGLAALSMAGKRPTNVVMTRWEDLSNGVRKRLRERTLLGDSLPSTRIPITPSRESKEISRVVNIP